MEKKKEIKAGLEIHQQLDTHKLFCSCPSLLRNDTPKFKVERKLNPVVGETGDIDVAAAYEKSKDKTFIYEVYDTNCLVELDEEPPHPINQEAIKIALQIALLLKCEIFPVTQVMRKTVIDGSNTSGFQRTVLIAHDGFIETSEGKVGIETIALEEDAARIVSRDKEKNTRTYKIDRLGIPLVEITTKPDLHSPEQIKEAALHIGEILRACKVKRGIGTIRQDLNISIPKSYRTEIKGFQDPRIMITTVRKEVQRQEICLKEKRCEKQVRRALPGGTTEFLRPMPGAARMYPETDMHLLKISREMINNAKENLPKLASEHRAYLDEFGLNEQLVKLILKQSKLEEFKFLIQIFNNPQLVAKTLVLLPKEIAVKNSLELSEVEKRLNQDKLETVLSAVKNNMISENDVRIVLQKIVEGLSLKEALEKENIDLKSEIEKIIKEKPGLSQGAYMGLVMAKFRGKVNGKEVMEELKKVLG